MRIESKGLKALQEKLDREVRLNKELQEKMVREITEIRKTMEEGEERLKELVFRERQIEIAEGYIEYHEEIIGLINRTDKELREGFQKSKT